MLHLNKINNYVSIRIIIIATIIIIIIIKVVVVVVVVIIREYTSTRYTHFLYGEPTPLPPPPPPFRKPKTYHLELT